MPCLLPASKSNLRLSLDRRVDVLTHCAKPSRSTCASSKLTRNTCSGSGYTVHEPRAPKFRAHQLITGSFNLQAPPKTPDVEVDGVHALKLTERVTLLRGICNDRFKFEVEYGLKRGTSDNCYVVRVRSSRAVQGWRSLGLQTTTHWQLSCLFKHGCLD